MEKPTVSIELGNRHVLPENPPHDPAIRLPRSRSVIQNNRCATVPGDDDLIVFRHDPEEIHR